MAAGSAVVVAGGQQRSMACGDYSPASQRRTRAGVCFTGAACPIFRSPESGWLQSALDDGRTQALTVRSRQFRWHPAYGEHAVLEIESHAPAVGVIEIEKLRALSGVTVRATGETYRIKPHGVDGRLGCLIFGYD